MIDIYAASRKWQKEGSWLIAPAGLTWIKEGYRVTLGNDVTLGDGCSDAIDLGFAEGYRKCIAQVDSVAYIGAGCRWFTLSKAIEHWANKDDRVITNCIMMSAIHIAAVKGWSHE